MKVIFGGLTELAFYGAKNSELKKPRSHFSFFPPFDPVHLGSWVGVFLKLFVLLYNKQVGVGVRLLFSRMIHLRSEGIST